MWTKKPPCLSKIRKSLPGIGLMNKHNGLYNHIAHMIKQIKKLNFLEQIICMKSNISEVFLYDYHNYSLLLLLLLLLIYY